MEHLNQVQPESMPKKDKAAENYAAERAKNFKTILDTLTAALSKNEDVDRNDLLAVDGYIDAEGITRYRQEVGPVKFDNTKEGDLQASYEEIDDWEDLLPNGVVDYIKTETARWKRTGEDLELHVRYLGVAFAPPRYTEGYGGWHTATQPEEGWYVQVDTPDEVYENVFSVDVDVYKEMTKEDKLAYLKYLQEWVSTGKYKDYMYEDKAKEYDDKAREYQERGNN